MRSSSEPDVRGWVVAGADGDPVGRVHGLLEDGKHRVRYLDVELDPGLEVGLRNRDLGRITNEENPPDRTRLGAGADRMLDVNPGSGEVYPTGEDHHPRVHNWKPPEKEIQEHGRGRHVLLPVGVARLREDDRQVILEGLRGHDVRDLPAYEHGPVSEEMESELRRRLTRGAVGGSAPDLYDADLFYGAGSRR